MPIKCMQAGGERLSTCKVRPTKFSLQLVASCLRLLELPCQLCHLSLEFMPLLLKLALARLSACTDVSLAGDDLFFFGDDVGVFAAQTFVLRLKPLLRVLELLLRVIESLLRVLEPLLRFHEKVDCCLGVGLPS